MRLYESCKILDVKIPFKLEELVDATLATCKANGFEECYIRPIVYIADGPLGVNPGVNPPIDVAILNWEWGSYLGDKGINEGARLKISSFVRPHVNSSMTKGKITGQYVNSVLAKREAIAAGYDEALLLDPEGYLTEGSGENIFVIKNGVVKTTPLTSILNGITRQTVLEYFANKGVKVHEARFTRDEVWCADEVFLTGTAAEITPVKEIDSRPIGAGRPGPITAELQAEFQNIVRGVLPSYGKHWLTPIV
jgi:branched-chain amino acid aminotransferase